MLLAVPTIALVAAGLIVAVIAFAVLFRSTWRVAEPNEALIVSGLGAGAGPEAAFRIVVGKGTVVLPGLQTVRRLPLAIREAALEIAECVTSQGIPVGVQGVVLFKVGDDMASISNAARRFLDMTDESINGQVHAVFEGHLRSIIGSLTVEEMINNRDRLRQETLDSSGDEMSRLGLVVDALQIREIVDPTGYIKNLAAPHAAEVTKQARIAQARADQEATQREQEAQALMAEATKATQIKQAGYYAEVETEKAKAAQAGPLAEAQARQQVVVQESEVAKREAEKREQQLQAEVVKPADAQAYATRKTAEADRDASIAKAEGDARRVELEGKANANATRVIGEADGAAIEARGLAKAKAIQAASEALAENQEAVIAQQLAERMPELVAAAAKSFEHIDNLNVLNGAQGMAEILTQLMAQGAVGMQVVGQMLDGVRDATANGRAKTAAMAPVAVPVMPNGALAEPAPPADPPAPEPEADTKPTG
jgi:flotillin